MSIRNTLKNRIQRLEADTIEGEPLIIFLNCINAASHAANEPGELVMAVIGGTGKYSGDTLHREEGEEEEAFRERVERRCEELRADVLTVELHGA